MVVVFFGVRSRNEVSLHKPQDQRGRQTRYCQWRVQLLACVDFHSLKPKKYFVAQSSALKLCILLQDHCIFFSLGKEFWKKNCNFSVIFFEEHSINKEKIHKKMFVISRRMTCKRCVTVQSIT